MNTKRIGNGFTIVIWIVAIFAVSLTVLTSLLLNSNSETETKKGCEQILDNLYQIFEEKDLDIPQLNQNNMYENVLLMQKYLNQSTSENCEKPVKHFPWITKTPYNNQVSPNYEITLCLELLSMYYRTFTLMPIDMILMSMMLYVKFQLEMVNMDLVKQFFTLQMFCVLIFFNFRKTYMTTPSAQ